MKYTILTTRSVMDIPYDSSEQYELDCAELWGEQNEIISELAPSKFYKCHFIEDPYYCNDITIYVRELDEAIQSLAIKDGVDLVRFENGKLGFMAYYNCHKNCFEFEPCSEEEYYKED